MTIALGQSVEDLCLLQRNPRVLTVTAKVAANEAASLQIFRIHCSQQLVMMGSASVVGPW